MGLRVADVMQTDVTSVREDTSLTDLERTFSRERKSGFPVVDDKGRLVGVVSRNDIVRKLAAEQSRVEYESDYYRDVGGFEEPPSGSEAFDLAARAGARLAGARVSDVMTSTPIVVAPGTSLREAAQLLVDRGIHRVPVVDDEGPVGILTSIDLVRLFAQGVA